MITSDYKVSIENDHVFVRYQDRFMAAIGSAAEDYHHLYTAGSMTKEEKIMYESILISIAQEYFSETAKEDDHKQFLRKYPRDPLNHTLV